MNLFTKAGPWVAASLFAAASAFGQTNSKCAPAQKSFEQGHEMMQNQMMAGYNAPARIDVRGAWDFYAEGTFTYWQPMQDNMELGIVSDVTTPLYNINGDVKNQNFDFKPGFKVRLGMNFDHDNWDSSVQYTWFRGTHTVSETLSTATPAIQLLPLWSIGNFITGGAFISGSEKWKLHMDLLDWDLARSYYSGTKLSFRPSVAIRAAWIRQNVDVDYTDAIDPVSLSVNGRDASINQDSHSWAIGPRVAMYSSWMIGEGFRFFGNGAGDILFTQYTRLHFNENYNLASGSSPVTSVVLINQRNVNCIRTHLELELGLGWGSYFDNNNWHVDLSAGYTFQVFFDQNMFRHPNNASSSTGVYTGQSISPNGNLYIQGLNVNLRFDF